MIYWQFCSPAVDTVLISMPAVAVVPEQVNTLRHAVIVVGSACLHLLLQSVCQSPSQHCISKRILLCTQQDKRSQPTLAQPITIHSWKRPNTKYLFQVFNDFWVFAAVISKPGPVVLPLVTPFWKHKRLLNCNWRYCSYCKAEVQKTINGACVLGASVRHRGVENTQLQSQSMGQHEPVLSACLASCCYLQYNSFVRHPPSRRHCFLEVTFPDSIPQSGPALINAIDCADAACISAR